MYEHVLVPTDGSETAEHAVDEALEVASRFDATVSALYVVDTDSVGISLGTEQVDRIRQGRFGEMDDLESRASDATRFVAERARERGLDVEEHARAGRPASVIADFADDENVDLIVMGSHGRSGLSRVVLGSVTEHVLRETHRSVLVVDTGHDDAEVDDG
ncbi:universal stress protein [Halorubellus sp. PRR65]|uniref:universal stress protein n=1 Tax=Halorubellus sp. PRR65 TaxID=3098148 RepID=UPI002B25A1A5|nr:universal stress protein [Halorubellus sp. PRR65]